MAAVLKTQAQTHVAFIICNMMISKYIPLALAVFGFQGESVPQTNSLSILCDLIVATAVFFDASSQFSKMRQEKVC